MEADVERDELELVTALQDAVQPAGVPVLPMFDLEGRCLVSSRASEPGGCWFDVVVLPDDRLAMIVGEAPGIGLTPSVTAAQMSAVIRAGLRRDGDVATALQLADVHAEDLPDSRGTAAVVVLLDSSRGIVTYATAGHPPPLLLHAEGHAAFLSDTGGGPLGTGLGTGYAVATHALSSDDGVLLVSPAAHRGAVMMTPGDAGDDWSEVGFGGLHQLADRLARRIAVEDTLCLVAARLRSSPHPELAVALHGGGDRIRRAREELGSWLAELRASPMDQMALTHAAAELVTNALEHSDQGDDRRVELQARLGHDGCVLIEVTNHGVWQVPPDDPHRGRGLAMAAGLVDHLAVTAHPSGTRAVLQHRLVRPVAIEASEQVNAERPVDAVEVTHAAPRSVSLRGAVGHDDVDEIAAQILIATRGGTVPLSLDLTAVTRLSTSAVRLLGDLTSDHRAVGMRTAGIEIITTAKSATQRALEIARVPHHVA